MAAALLNALCLAQTSAPALEAAPAVKKFLHVLLAIGACVLVVWLLPRLADRRKLSLDGTPARRNSLNVVHVVLPAAVFIIVLGVVASVLANPDAAIKRPEVSLPAALAAQLCGAATAMIIASRTFAAGLSNGLGFTARHWLHDTMRGLLAYLGAFPIVVLLLQVGEMVLPRHQHMMLEWVRSDLAIHWKALIFASAVVAAPLAEELYFRGIIQSALRQYTGRPWTAVLATAAVFAAVHWGDQPQAVGALFALGVALGYVYERSGRLLPSMVLHGAFNGINLALTSGW